MADQKRHNFDEFLSRKLSGFEQLASGDAWLDFQKAKANKKAGKKAGLGKFLARLTQFEVTTPPNAWDEFKAAYARHRSARNRRLLWWSAALLLFLLSSLFLFVQKDQPSSLSEVQTFNEQPVQVPEATEKQQPNSSSTNPVQESSEADRSSNQSQNGEEIDIQSNAVASAEVNQERDEPSKGKPTKTQQSEEGSLLQEELVKETDKITNNPGQVVVTPDSALSEQQTPITIAAGDTTPSNTADPLDQEVADKEPEIIVDVPDSLEQVMGQKTKDQKKGDKEPVTFTPERRLITLGLRIAPEYSFRRTSIANGSENKVHEDYQSIVDRSEQASTAFTAGFSFDLIFFDRVSVSTGFNFTQKTVSASYQYEINRVPVIDLENGGVILDYINVNNPEKVDQTVTNTFNFVEVPLILGYYVDLNNRWKLKMSGGASALFFVGAKGQQVTSDFLTLNNFSRDAFRKQQLGWIVGAGASCRLSNLLSIEVEPTYRTFARSIFDSTSDIEVRPYSFGINTTLQFGLK